MGVQHSARTVPGTIALLFFIAQISTSALACCESFGEDTVPIDKVQASWGPAEQLMAAGRYSEAITALRATERYLPSIKNAFLRGCVEDGANIRIVSAEAGAAELKRSQGDTATAGAAAKRAWIHYPGRHDCP